MSNNNRREPPNNNYPPHQNRQQRYPPRQGQGQGQGNGHGQGQGNGHGQGQGNGHGQGQGQGQGQGPPHPPFPGNHYPPYYPPPYYPPYKEDSMRHPYNQQPMPSNFYYPPYPPYPIPYPNYQQQPFPYPQPPQNQMQSAPERKNYQQRNHEQRQDRNQDLKPRVYGQERKTFDARNDRGDRYEPRQERSERNYEPRESKPSPHHEKPIRHEESDKKRENSDCDSYDERESSSDSESEEVVYRRKAIAKRKDPVLDSKQEIRRWIEARKRNYPKRSLRPEEAQGKVQQSQLSILEKKIRKKILLINADPKSMMKKMKDIDILRRFILYSRKPRRMPPAPMRRPERQQQNEPIQQQPALPQAEHEAIVELQPELPAIVELQPELPISKSEANLPQEGEEAVEQPIKPWKDVQRSQQPRGEYGRREELSVEVIIKHLQMKQAEDTKTLESLMDYKSNSFHFRYQHQTLETNLLLDSIFSETSYILQAIRYIVKNNFFDAPLPQQ